MPRILSTQATMPPMPAGGFDPPPLDTYLKALVMSLNADRVQVGDRIARRVLYGSTSGFPTARGGGDLYYDTTVGDLYIDTGTWDLVFTSVPAHTHDDRYYTESEVDALLHAESHTIASHSDTTATGTELETLTDGSNADALHAHAGVAHTIASHSDTTATGTELETLTDGSNADSLHDHDYAASSHNHDDRYYTESQVDSLLGGKSDTSHTHDSRYYTETEVDNLLDTYLPLSAGSGQQLTGDLYLNYNASGRGIIAKGSGGQNYTLIGLAATSQNVFIGDSSRNIDIHGDAYMKFQAVYLDLNANQLLMGGGLINTEGGDINLGTAGKVIINSLDMCQVVSSQRIFGFTTSVTWVEGSNLRMYGAYKIGASTAPPYTLFTDQAWGVYLNTGADRAWFCFRNGTDIYRLELTKY